MNKQVLSTTLMAALFLFSSCAAMFRTSSYTATIETGDPSVKIYSRGELIGTGKVTKTFKRKNDLSITLKKDGCEDVVRNFDKKFGIGYVLFNWGLAGLVIDIATGAIYKPDHNGYKEITKIDLTTFEIDLKDWKCN